MIILSLLCILFYIIYVVIKYGIPHSLSATYYSLVHKVIFSLVLAVSAGLILPTLLSITPDRFQFLTFLSIAGIMFVAAAPDYENDSLTDTIHTGSAIIALILSQVWVGLMNPIALLCWIPMIIYIIYWYKNLGKSNIKFWGEITMLLTIYVTLMRYK